VGNNICDEVAQLAQQYMMEPTARGLQRIDEKIAVAKRDSCWDEMSKWHRVRFRLIRLQRQRSQARQIDFGSESRRAI
jgi:hypothetical protein